MWRWMKTSVKDLIENVLEIGRLNPATETFFELYNTTEGEYEGSKESLREQILDTIDDIRTVIQVKAPAYEIREILEKCSFVNAVINARHEDSYTLVQYAIINDRADVLNTLLSWSPWIDQPICGRPLHLASLLGNFEVVQMLLEDGTNVNNLSCVCYPSSHRYACKRYDKFSMHRVNGCHGDYVSQTDSTVRSNENAHVYPALYFAIFADNVHIVKILEKYGCRMDFRLHVSCRLGSHNCMAYFLQSDTNCDLSRVDNLDKTPIQHAVVHGKTFVKCLEARGADIFAKTTEDETLLHLLLKDAVFGRDILQVHQTLKFLLEKGLQEYVNFSDLKGRTPLHILLSRANYHILKEREKEARERVMQDIQDSVIILLEYGASTAIYSARGESPLHILIQPLNRNASIMTPMKKLPVKSIDEELVSHILPILLDYGADPNIDFRDVSVMSLLLRNALYPLKTNALDRYLTNFSSESSMYLDRCIDSLCEYGYDVRQTKRVCLLHIVLNQIDNVENLNKFLLESSSKARLITQNIAFTREIIESLLNHNVDCNSCRIVQSDLNAAYHVLTKHIRVIPFSQIHSVIWTFMVHGADPNLGGKHMPMSVFRRSTKVHSPIFPLLHLMNLLGTKCSQLPFEELWRLFHMFFSTMSDRNVRQCVENYLEYDCYRFKNPKLELEEFFRDIVVTPRSLSSQCARRIYLLLRRKLTLASGLPLPNLTIQYIKSCEW